MNNKNNTTNASRYTRKAVENLKAVLNAAELQEIKLSVYGIQVYAYELTGNEYEVIINAERDLRSGRYYFITRDGVRLPWSRFDSGKLAHACVDFLDRMEAEREQAYSAAGIETAEEESRQDEQDSAAGRLWATVKDYAAGTMDGIKDRAKRIINRLGRTARRFWSAALLLFVRVLFMVVGLSSGLAVIFGTALVIPEITPDGFASCLFLRVPALFIAVCLWGVVWCWSFCHILPARLFDYIQHGNR